MATVKGTYFDRYIIPSPVGSNRDITPMFSETFTPGSTNDIRKLIKVPINCTFGAGTFFQAGDMDSGTALVLTLRATDDGSTFKTLIHQSTAGQAGGIARPTKGPTVEDGIGFTTDSSDWWVELLISTQATGAQSATFIYGIHLCGWGLTIQS